MNYLERCPACGTRRKVLIAGKIVRRQMIACERCHTDLAAEKREAAQLGADAFEECGPHKNPFSDDPVLAEQWNEGLMDALHRHDEKQYYGR